MTTHTIRQNPWRRLPGFLVVSVLFLLSGFGGICAAAPAQPTPRPNFLLLVGDDVGPTLGCYGDTQANTPTLDRLATQGIQFNRAYVTQSSCSPSRSSMLTGLYPHQNGMIGLGHVGYSMRSDVITLPRMLKDAGYRTGLIGKVHLVPDSTIPFDFRVNPGQLKNSRDPVEYAKQFTRFLSEKKNAPFFVMVGFIDAHRVFERQVNGMPANPRTGANTKALPFVNIDDPKVREETADYYNGVARFDIGVSMILDELERAGLTTDTVVLALGDNGPSFTRGKTTCYESGVRTPIIVRWPGHIDAGKKSEALVSTVDIVPTFLEMAGISPKGPLAGKSLAGVVAGRQERVRDTVCTEYTAHVAWQYYPRRSVTDGRWKLIHNLLSERPNPTLGVDHCAAWQASRQSTGVTSETRAAFDTYHHPPAVELYDLSQDPVEFHNLADKPEVKAERERLEKALADWQKETDDPLADARKLTALTHEHDTSTSGGKRLEEDEPVAKKPRKPNNRLRDRATTVTPE